MNVYMRPFSNLCRSKRKGRQSCGYIDAISFFCASLLSKKTQTPQAHSFWTAVSLVLRVPFRYNRLRLGWDAAAGKAQEGSEAQKESNSAGGRGIPNFQNREGTVRRRWRVGAGGRGGHTVEDNLRVLGRKIKLNQVLHQLNQIFNYTEKGPTTCISFPSWNPTQMSEKG